MAEEWGRRAMGRGVVIETRLGGDPELSDLLKAGSAGDPLANEVLDEGARALGRGLVSSLHLINPEILVLGGGILEARPRHKEIAIETLKESILPKALERLTISSAECGNRAGMIGAFSLAAHSFGSQNKGVEPQ